jgi:hypothetical protein
MSAMADAPKAPAPAVEEWSQNKRFIRTLESDTAALKTGVVTGFVSPKVADMPIAPAPLDPLTRAVASASGMASDELDLDKEPTFDPARLGAIPADTDASSAAERLVGASTIEEIPALTADLTPIAPPAAPPASDSPAPIHTYTSDFSQAVEEQHATPATILAAEQDSARRVTVVAPASSGINRFLIIGAIALVGLGAAGAYAAYSYAKKPQTVAVAAVAPVRIFVDERVEVTGTGAALANAIDQSVATPLAANAVRLLSLANATPTSVFSALTLPAPDILLRNVNGPESIAGVVNVSGAQSPFFILAVESYSDTFSGMLDWEPDMATDLATLYPAIGTSTPASTFVDDVVDNHNVRELKDSAGNLLIIYGYFDQGTLVIARDEDAFTELIGRLTNSRTQQ